MFNGAIVTNMINTFGIEATITFCKMEAHKYELLYKSFPDGDDEATQALHERDWWYITREDLERKIRK